MKKISVNKSDEVAVIVEKIIDTPDNEVILSIPRFSHLGESLSNFHLLKREADALDKKISIESVDDHVIELAEMSGLSAVNPFFTKNKRQFSDIVAPKAGKAKKRKPVAKVFQEEEVEEAEEPKAIEAEAEKPFISPVSPLTIFGKLSKGEEKKPTEGRRLPLPKISMPKLSLPSSRWLSIFIVAAALALAGWAGAVVLPRAAVTIVAQTKDWNYNDSINTNTGIGLDVGSMSIPNQIFSESKNLHLKFPATGRRQVERHATGVITVYNSYSSDPQPLVERTRFISPDGKMYRLADGITVPGAKIIEGKIVPSNIDAEVIADEPGPEFNIGPVKLFTIPGFKGTPKYQSFYGESTGDMSGGFIGEVAYPTSEDIAQARSKAGDELEGGLKAALLTQIPQEFKVLDGATEYEVLEQAIDEEADENGEFGIFTEAKMTAVAFKEEDLQELLALRAKRDNGEDFDIRSSEIEFGLARVDFGKGILSFPVDFKAVLAKRIDIDDLQSRILGKSETELKTAVFSLPGLESATISLWPFWVKTVPTNPDKINITVE